MYPCLLKYPRCVLGWLLLLMTVQTQGQAPELPVFPAQVWFLWFLQCFKSWRLPLSQIISFFFFIWKAKIERQGHFRSILYIANWKITIHTQERCRLGKITKILRTYTRLKDEPVQWQPTRATAAIEVKEGMQMAGKHMKTCSVYKLQGGTILLQLQ